MKSLRQAVFLTTAASTLILAACDVLPPRANLVEKTFPPVPLTTNASTPTQPPEAVTNALIPSLDAGALQATPSQATFNVSVHEADAREFFMGLVVDSQENMIVHPDVNGRISLELKNVTLPQVLSAVQKVYGYDFSKTDIGYIIYPATLQTKIFKIDHIDLLREGRSNTRVSSGQINDNNNRNFGLGMGGNVNMGGMPGGTGANQAFGQQGPTAYNSTSGSWITTSSRTDFWKELEDSLSAILDATPSTASTPESGELTNPQTGSKAVINRQTGVIVVKGTPSQIREAEKLIEATQNQIGRQVVIEAKILEIILNDEHQDGVNWASIVREGAQTFLAANNPLPASLANVHGALNVFKVGGKWGDFQAFITLMESQGKTNILSSPRISTLNNQKAVIKVGQDEYFITDVSSNNILSGGGTNNTVTQDITWTPFFSGIALDVTPQIADDNKVTLHIHPSITRVQDQKKEFKINGQEGSIPMALNTVRESDSVVSAENGQIIVIGGLMQEDRDENKRGVSLLSRIPFLGNAFRENTGTGRKSELVILLKPTIIANDNDWEAPMQESRDRLERLEKKQLWK